MLFSISFRLNLLVSNININDIFSRIQINDFFINTYYYYWTTFWYIPLFISILILSLASFHIKNLSKFLIFIYVLLIFLLVLESVDYWYLNSNYFFTQLYNNNFNILLTNSINKYHPFMFYSTISMFFYLYVISNNFVNSSFENFKYIGSDFIKFIKLYKFIYLFIISYTLFLGSWWALQEGSWGGWWNWDPSEVFGLIVLGFILLLVHKNFKLSNFFKYLISFKILFLCIFFTYVFIQLNFNLISHNFSIRINQFINVSQLFMFFLIITTTFLVFFYFIYTTLKKNYHLNLNLEKINILKKYNFTYFILINSILILVILFNSFFPLINDFLKQTFALTMTNINTTLLDILILIFIINYLVFFTFSPYFIVLLFFIILHTSLKLTMLIFFILYFIRLNYILHFILLLFLLININSSSLILTTWDLLTVNTLFINNNKIFYPNITSFTVSNNFLEYIDFFLTNNMLNESIWSFFSKNSTLETHLFYHSILDDLVTQSLLNGNFFQKFSINIFDFSPSKLIIVYFWLVSLFIQKFFKKKLIIY